MQENLNTYTPNNTKESFFLPIFHIFLLLLLVLLFALPFIFDPQLWLSRYKDYILALDFMRENGFQLAPQISQGLYLKEFPFAFWVLGAFTHFFPHFSNSILLIGFYISSLFFFVFSVYILGSSLFFSSKISFSASLIALTSFFAIGYTPFAGYDLYFVSFVNLSLAFAFRAYLKPIAPVFLFLAFVFMTLGFFSGGFFAYALRICTSICFLILCGNFSRFKRNDVYIFTLSFLVILIIAFILFYTHGHREYVALITDMEKFQNAFMSWELTKHAVYYLFAIICIFLPYILSILFIKSPISFAPLFTFLQKIKIPQRFRKEVKREKTAEEIAEEEAKAREELLRIEEEKRRAEEELHYSENFYPQINFEKIEEEIEENTENNDNTVNEVIEKYSDEEILLNKSRKKSSTLFLFSLLFSGIVLLCFYPVSTFTYVLFLAPAFSLVFAKLLSNLTTIKSQIFFGLTAWFILFIGIMTLAGGMIPEWSKLYPHVFANMPQTFAAILLSPSKFAYFMLGTIIIALSLLYLFSDKSKNYKSLFHLILLFILLSWSLNLILYSQVDLQISATQHIEDVQKTSATEANN